jgi:heme A synthase
MRAFGKSPTRPTSALSFEEVPLNWNKWIRQTHRWLSMAFTVAVVINLIAVLKGSYTNKLGFLAVATLALQFVSGLYLFVLPYATRWRSRLVR